MGCGKGLESVWMGSVAGWVGSWTVCHCEMSVHRMRFSAVELWMCHCVVRCCRYPWGGRRWSVGQGWAAWRQSAMGGLTVSRISQIHSATHTSRSMLCTTSWAAARDLVCRPSHNSLAPVGLCSTPPCLTTSAVFLASSSQALFPFPIPLQSKFTSLCTTSWHAYYMLMACAL